MPTTASASFTSGADGGPTSLVARLSSGDPDVKLSALREVKNQIIGSKTKKLDTVPPRCLNSFRRNCRRRLLPASSRRFITGNARLCQQCRRPIGGSSRQLRLRIRRGSSGSSRRRRSAASG
ncbi:unnamed protein product [Linum trigynum]|uniref:Uncharacterized protein n=1 Tax=Linum trigynum TaxID=586398 RepID=A0AAV2D8Q3_9ROSI